MGLDAFLRPLPVDSPRAALRLPAGAPFPVADRRRKKALGAFDTPPSMARRLVALGLSACETTPRCALDPGCGTGGFLAALAEAGVEEIRGEDLDEAALAVARVVAPRARLSQRDGLLPGESVDLVVGNPPYVPPERQDKASRRALKERFPWLHGRFDLAVPFAWAASLRVHQGGGLALLLPAPFLVQPYGLELRRRWVASHRLTWLGQAQRFPGATVQVVMLALRAGAGPAPLPAHGTPPEEVLALPAVPLNPSQRPGDWPLLQRLRERSLVLGDLAEIDTGVVSHGPGHGREALLHDEPGPGRVPYVDARDLQQGRRRWLAYQPERMHRPKRPGLFAPPKILVMRIAGQGPLRAWLDAEGLFAGHTLTVVRPTDPRVAPERLLDLIRSPLSRAVLRLERGERVDVYPRDLRQLPVPRAWLERPALPLSEAWGLQESEVARLRELGS